MGKIIGLVVVAVLLIGGFLYWNAQKDRSATEKMTDGVATAPRDVPSDAVTGEESTVSSIWDAMNLGQKMQCTYVTTEDGKSAESTVLVDGGKFKSTTTMGTVTAYALFDGENQYFWTSEPKTGMKFTKTCLEDLRQRTKNTLPSGVSMPQDVEKAFGMANNVHCEAAAAADFSLPSDVNFTDQCAMMGESLKMMRDLKGQLPAGVTLPGM